MWRVRNFMFVLAWASSVQHRQRRRRRTSDRNSPGNVLTARPGQRYFEQSTCVLLSTTPIWLNESSRHLSVKTTTKHALALVRSWPSSVLVHRLGNTSQTRSLATASLHTIRTPFDTPQNVFSSRVLLIDTLCTSRLSRRVPYSFPCI